MSLSMPPKGGPADKRRQRRVNALEARLADDSITESDALQEIEHHLRDYSLETDAQGFRRVIFDWSKFYLRHPELAPPGWTLPATNQPSASSTAPTAAPQAAPTTAAPQAAPQQHSASSATSSALPTDRTHGAAWEFLQPHSLTADQTDWLAAPTGSAAPHYVPADSEVTLAVPPVCPLPPTTRLARLPPQDEGVTWELPEAPQPTQPPGAADVYTPPVSAPSSPSSPEVLDWPIPAEEGLGPHEAQPVGSSASFQSF